MFALAYSKRPNPAVLAIVIYLIIFAAFNVVIYNHKNSFWLKQHAFNANHNKLECLVFGNSHALYGICPQELGIEAMNFANVAQSLQMDCGIIRKYINSCPNLKLVIINISYHSLYYSVLNSLGEERRDCYANLYYGGVSEASSWQKLLEPKYLVPSILFGSKRCLEIIRYRLKDPSAQEVDESKIFDDRGWCKWWNVYHFTDEGGLSRMQLHNQQMNAKFLSPNLEALEQTIQLCKQHNVKVLFVTLPTWTTYRKHIDRQRWQKCQDTVRQLCSKYGCEYANYFSDSRFNQEDFADDDHLMIAGAWKASRLLRKEYLENMLASTPVASKLHKNLHS